MTQLFPVQRHRHRDKIATWLATDHVARWWGDADARLHQFDETPADNHAMIVRDGEPIGYVRWQVVDTAALSALGLDEIPAGSVDADLFIGEPDLTGKGIGPQAIRLLFDHLHDTTDAPLVGFCTSIENGPAHSAFRRAGCDLKTTYDDPTFGPCHVFVRWLR